MTKSGMGGNNNIAGFVLLWIYFSLIIIFFHSCMLDSPVEVE
jgi:hypothetical protein